MAKAFYMKPVIQFKIIYFCFQKYNPEFLDFERKLKPEKQTVKKLYDELPPKLLRHSFLSLNLTSLVGYLVVFLKITAVLQPPNPDAVFRKIFSFFGVLVVMIFIVLETLTNLL